MYTENRTRCASVMMRMRSLSKFNFLSYLKSKKNLVTLRKCNSHLQYHKIDLSFSIKLQEINLPVCEDYISPSAKRAMRMCPRSGYIF